MQETQVPSPDGEDPLEEGMATHSSILAGKIPWIKELGRLQSIRTQSRTQLKRLTTHTTNFLKDEIQKKIPEFSTHTPSMT